MVQTITATYVQRAEDWKVSVSGLGRTLNGEAPGIIAARDRADQLVEELVPEGNHPTVVHLLNGSAFEFTSTYMEARLARTDEGPTRADAHQATTGETAEAVTEADGGSDSPRESAESAENEESAVAQADTRVEKETVEKETVEKETKDTDSTDTGQAPVRTSTPAVPRKELDRSPESASTGRRYAHAAS